MSEERFNQELKMISNGRSAVRTPQFPGQQKGYSIEQIRSIIKKQKRVKGFPFALATGSNTFNLDLSGTARIFLGFVLLPPVPTVGLSPESFNLTINNEIIVDQTHPIFFTQAFMDDEYYFIPRPLSGTDEITVNIENSQQPQEYFMAVYYI